MWAFFGPLLILAPIILLFCARTLAARAVGMKGIRLLGGHIENAEAAGPGRRAAVVLIGMGTTYLLAGGVLALALSLGGKDAPSTVIIVMPGRPAEAAGLESGDRIVDVAGEAVSTWEAMSAAIGRRPGQPTEVTAMRGDQEIRVTVVPKDDNGRGKIGVLMKAKTIPASGGEIGRTLVTGPARVIADLVPRLFAPAARPGEVGGPVAIVADATPLFGVGPLLAAGRVLSFVWPITALLAVTLVPQRPPSRKTGERRREEG